MTVELICKKTDRQTQEKSTSGVQPNIEPVILCKNCNAFVTKPGFAVHTEHGFSQTFANPAGYVFEIGCFATAPGCCEGSAPSNEFSWYPGYEWCIGICRNCAFQLGWVFLSVRQGQGSKFYGLVLDYLIFP